MPGYLQILQYRPPQGSRRGMVLVKLTSEGFQDVEDFRSLCQCVPRVPLEGSSLTVLVDWLKLEVWVGSVNKLNAFRELADQIIPLERVAIVHNSRFNRDAALFGAALRTARMRVDVRSWPPYLITEAIQWLSSLPPQPTK